MNFKEEEIIIAIEQVGQNKAIVESRDSLLYGAFNFMVSAAVFLVPLFFLPWTSGILELQKQTLLAGITGTALILWLIATVKTGVFKKVRASLNLPVALLIAAAFLSSVFSLDFSRSFLGIGEAVSGSFSTLLSFAVLFFLIILTVNDGGGKIIRILAVSSVAAMVFGIFQFFGVFSLPFSFSKSASFNTIGSVNFFGLFSALMIVLLAGTRHFDGSVFWRYLRYLGIGSAFFVLVFINWWVLWAVTGFGFLMFILSSSLVKRFTPKKHLLGMSVIVVGLFLMLTGFNLAFLKNSLLVEISLSQKLSFRVLQNALTDRPVFGFGPENFLFAYEKFGSQSLGGTVFSELKFSKASSEFLNFVAENGLAGAVAAAYFLFSIALLIINKVKSNENSGNSVPAFVAASVLAYFLYPFNMSLGLIFWVGLALLSLDGQAVKKSLVSLESSPKYSLASSFVFIVGLVLVLTGFYYSSVKYISDFKYARAASLVDSSRVLGEVVAAINLYPADSRYYLSGSNIILSDINKELQSSKNGAKNKERLQNLIQNAFEITRKATDKNPYDSSNWAQRAFVYQNLSGVVGGVENMAIQYYQEALVRNPGNAAIYNQIGQVYLNRSALLNNSLSNSSQAQKASILNLMAEDLNGAEENFKEAININSRFGSAIYNLGVVYDRQGKIKEAISQLEAIAPFNSNNAGLAFELGLLYYRDNQKTRALGQMQKVLEIFPDYSNALWYMALLYEERGELNRAITNLEKILSVEQNRNNPTVIQKIEELRNGIVAVPSEKVTDQPPLE